MAETVAAALVAAESSTLVTAGFIIGGNAALVNTALLVAANYAVGQDARRKARNQARDAANAAAQDRQITTRSAVTPRPVIYGRARVAGQLAYWQATGSLGEYLHLVLAFAGHECDAIESVYFNDVLLPAPDGSGNINSGAFSKTNTLSATETTTSGSLVLANTPTTITSVTKLTGPDVVNGVLESLTSPTGYTLAGSTVTFAAGAGPTYTVNYDYQTTTAVVRLKKYLGAAGQTADADLITESGGKWTSAHVGVGICYLYARLKYDQDVFGQIGVPNVTAVIRGKKVFDPRSSTTYWSPNAHLCTRDWLRDTTHGLGSASGEVPDSETITGANICDEEVTLYNTGTVSVTNGSPNVTGSGTTWLVNAYVGQLFVSTDGVRYTVSSVTDNTHLVLTANYGGSTLSGQSYSFRQLRYTANGVLGTEASPKANLAKLLTAMAGTAVWVQGRWLVRAGAYVTPALTFNEDYLRGEGVSIVPRASRRDQCNRVTGTFFDQYQGFAEVQIKAVVNTTYKAADGGLELTREIELPLCGDAIRAQRMAKIVLEKSRVQANTLQMSCNHKAYDAAPTDTVSWNLTRYGYSAKVLEVKSRRYTPSVGLEYVWAATASTMWDWNLGDATVYSAASATNLPNPFAVPATLGSLACNSSATVNGSIGSTLVPRGLVTWTASTDVFVQQGGRIEIQWKLWSDTDWQKAPPVPGDSTSTYISPLQPIGITLIRARAVNAAGRAGLWATITHTVATGGSLGGGNLLTNSSFEVDSNADGLPDGWVGYSNGTGGTISYSLVTGGLRGGKYLRVDATNLGTASSDQAGAYSVIELNNLVGATYVLSAYLYGLGAGSGSVDLRLYIDFYDGAGGTGSTTGNASVVLSRPSSSLLRYALTGTIPASTVSCRAHVWMQARGTSAGACHFRADDLQFEIGAVPTSYAPKTDEILAGAVGTTQIASTAVTTPKLDTNARGLRRVATQASTVTVTETTHIPDGYNFKTQLVADSQFTAAYNGYAVVTFTGTVSLSASAGTTEWIVGNTDVSYNGNDLQQTGPNPIASTYQRSVSNTLMFALTAGDTYTFEAYASKNAGGETVSFNTMQLLVEVTYTG